MNLAKIQVSGVRAVAVDAVREIPAGIVGATVELEYTGGIWAGLNKTVIFRGNTTKEVLTGESTVTVPAEVVAEPRGRLRVGVYGTDAANNLIMPTLWAELGVIADSAEPSEPADSALPIWAQLYAMIGNLGNLDTAAKSSLVAAVNELVGKSGSADPEEIKKIMEDYLAANPPKADEQQIADAVEEYMAENLVDCNIKPVAKTAEMTQPVGIDENGQLWVAPIGGGSSGGDDSGETEPTTRGIVWDLVNVTSSNSVASVNDGASLSAVLTPADGYTLGDVTVAMGGEALTGVWNADTATVTIASVTGDVVISCAGVVQTGPIDTSPVIVEYDKGLSGTIGTINSFTGVCYTKVYRYEPDIEGMKASTYYDAENDYLTANGIAGYVMHYTPNLKFVEAGYSQTGITNKASKIWLYHDDAPAPSSAMSNSNVTLEPGGTPAEAKALFGRYSTDVMYANGIAFTLSTLDIDDSYAYWGTTNGTVLPIGVRAGDIIFAGKNTPYYGMANIDGTMAGGGASTASELSIDDDIAQNYAVATTSVMGEEPKDNASTVYGISDAFAGVITNAKKEWMAEYAGDYRKIPIIVSTDQHGRTNLGIFNLIGKTFSMHDISKVMNLGDTISTWYDSDTEHPLLSDSGLESWCESVKAIPFSKQLNVFGNHDTWYGNYEDEGNPIGTRYPSSQAHLNQYFRNIYARRTNNNGWFVIHDDQFNVKYVVISAFEYQGTVTFRIGTDQMKFIIDEFSKDDGYDIVVVSHVPLRYKSEEMIFPTGFEYTTSEDYRVSNIDTDAFFSARKAKSSGTITDSDGVSHSYDFTGCNTDIVCAVHGHTHHDAYNYVGGSLLSSSFDWFDDNTIFLALIDRVNNQLNVWKVDGTPQYVNYQIPFDKPTE